MQFIKKRLRPGLGKQSEYLTRTYNKFEINNTDVDNKKIIKNSDHLKFVKNWYKKRDFIKNITDDKITSEKEIEYLYSQRTVNPFSDFQEFLLHNYTNTKLNCDYAETRGDIFALNKNIAIGHCVSKCFTMSKGIALQFKNKFNNTNKLINQNKNITEISHLKLNDQWILYLITKNNYNDKPTYSNIFKTLKNTKQFCLENNITKLALPKICSGLDKKRWDIIANMIQFIFQNSTIKIRIFSLPDKGIERKLQIKNDNVSKTSFNIISKNNLDKNLQKEIVLIAGSFVKIKEVPADGDCGAHALRVCLRNHDINITTLEILNMLTIPNCKSGYYLTDEDLAFICDQYNMNLFIIYEINENSNAIVYWKSNRENIGIFHKNCHWTPGISVEINNPRKFANITISTKFPDLDIIKKNIDTYLDKYPNKLQLQNQNYDHDDIITTKAQYTQKVLSIIVEHEGTEKFAIIDTGSNISCIDHSLIDNMKHIINKNKVVITGTDNSKLEQLGKTKLVIKINNNKYSIDAYVIKGLNCEILLGNDFNIKNNLIINFKDKILKLNKNVIIPLYELRHNYNTQNNNNNIGIENNIANINDKQKYIGKIESNSNKVIPPKNKINIKHYDIKANTLDSVFVIEPIKRLNKEKFLKLESTNVNNENGITLYNVSNLHSNISSNILKGITITNIIKTIQINTKKDLPEIKIIPAIYTTKKKQYNDKISNEIEVLTKRKNNFKFRKKKS